MIAVNDKFPKLTPEEYFIWEEQQLLRHEYLSGRVYSSSITLGKKYDFTSLQAF